MAQAYRVGAPLMEWKMIQYHPTTLVENGLLITEGARGEGAHSLKLEAERFMRSRRRTRWSSPRGTSCRAHEQTEINEGRVSARTSPASI